jgi:hypothetical protein
MVGTGQMLRERVLRSSWLIARANLPAWGRVVPLAPPNNRRRRNPTPKPRFSELPRSRTRLQARAALTREFRPPQGDRRP